MSGSTATTTTTETSTTRMGIDIEDKFKNSFVLFGLDKFCNDERLTRALKEFGVPFVKLKKIIPNEFAIVTFENQQEKMKWMNFLNDKKRIDGKLLNAKERKFKEKLANSDETNFYGEKKIRVDDELSGSDVIEALKEETHLFHDLDYLTQIALKQQEFTKHLKDTIRSISQESKYDLPYWISNLKGGVPCDPDEIQSLKSPPGEDYTKHYRNKASFAIGYDPNGNPCVVFNEDRTEHGISTIVHPAEDKILPSIMIKIKDSVRSLVIKSRLPPWDKMTKNGFWRNLILKTFTTGEIMVLFQVNPLQSVVLKNTTPFNENDPKVDENKYLDEPNMIQVKELILKHFEEESKKEDSFKVNSIEWQVYSGVSDIIPTDIPYRLLWGENQVTENLFGMKFKISPNASFHPNTRATELLYQVVREYALKQIIFVPELTEDEKMVELTKEATEKWYKKRNPEASSSSSTSTSSAPKERPYYKLGSGFDVPSVLIDIYCGTGAIGQYLAKEIEKIQSTKREKIDVRITGVESSQEVVNDALQNAKENSLANYTCIQGKAEESLRNLLSKLKSKDRVVVVVDPPRSGLDPNVIKLTREAHQIDRIVYVSSNPLSLVRDLAHFARSQSNNMIGTAFKPLRAVCVDMSPYTTEAVYVVLLKRAMEREYSPRDTSKYQEGIFIRKKRRNLKKKVEKRVNKQLTDKEVKIEKEKLEEENAKCLSARRPRQPPDPKFSATLPQTTPETTTSQTAPAASKKDKGKKKVNNPDVINLTTPTKRRFDDIAP